MQTCAVLVRENVFRVAISKRRGPESQGVSGFGLIMQKVVRAGPGESGLVRTGPTFAIGAKHRC